MAQVKENVPVYGVRQKHLGEYTTKEKDALKGIHKIPLELSRLTDEDLVNIELIKEERMKTRADSSNEEKTTRAESMFK